jgi:hypothetical protein
LLWDVGQHRYWRDHQTETNGLGPAHGVHGPTFEFVCDFWLQISDYDLRWKSTRLHVRANGHQGFGATTSLTIAAYFLYHRNNVCGQRKGAMTGAHVDIVRLVFGRLHL